MQQKLDIKKHAIANKGQAALEQGFQNQLVRQEEKKERERLAILAEKNAMKA